MTVSNFKIPVINEPQTFEIELSGISYILTCKWNDATDAGWILDISDSDSIPIVCNIPLVTGTNLLEGLDYLSINGALVVFTDGDDTAVPTLTNLGIESNLYFQTVVSDG